MDEETPKKREFLFSTSVQYAAQSGVDDSGVDHFSLSFPLWLENPLVLDRTGRLAFEHSSVDGYYGLGGTVRKRA